MTRHVQWQIERTKSHLQLHSFGAKSARMQVKHQSTLLSERKQSGSQELENFGGALVRRLELAWRLWHSGTVAPCLIDLIEQPDGTLPAPDPHRPAQCRVG